MGQRKPQSAGAGLFDWAAWLVEGPIPRDDRFKPVEILGVLNRDRFLAVLNGNRDFPQRTFKLRPWAALGNAIRLRSANVLPNAQLRLYVDEWLNTGVDNRGVEIPTARDLRRAPNACAAVHRFAGKQPLRLEPARKGLRLQFPSELSVSGLGSPADVRTAVADRFFSLFLLCDWRARLAKCRRVDCGHYFELKHWNRTYKRGILCPKCQRGRSLESAVRSTSRARKAAESELYRLIGRRFRTRLLKSPDWHRDPKLRTRIVEFLNVQIKETNSLQIVYPRGITGKWLSWSKNRNGITKTVRGKVNSKS